MKPTGKSDSLQYTKEKHDFCSRRVTGQRCSDMQIIYDRQNEPMNLDSNLDIDNGSQRIEKLLAQCLISLDNIKQFLLKPKHMHRRRNQMSSTTLSLRGENSCMLIKERKKKRMRQKGKRQKLRKGRLHEANSQDKVHKLIKTFLKKINLTPLCFNISYNRNMRRLFKKKVVNLIGNNKSLHVKIDSSRSKALSTLKDLVYKWTRNQFKQTWIVYPVSGQTLNNYLDSIGNTSQLPSDSLQFELIRLQTFSRYPENAPVRPIRLAEAGFYHTGNGSEVRCYSCGKTYTDWKQGDSPRDIHFRMSPHCIHIRRNENENITTESGTENRSQSNSFENNSGGIEQTQRRHSEENSQIQCEMQQQNHLSSQQQHEQQQHHQQIQNNTTHRPYTNTTVESQPSASRTHASSRYDPLGINFDRPKYQAYAVLAVRISSFHGWPSHLTQSAREMAIAGYFYAGYSDYCRCFFCGGGLRNWDAGDDPWVEHARWFPRCQFLRMNKGFGFIELVQQRLTEMKNGQEHVTNLESTEGATGTGIEPVPSTDDLWSHPSIQSVQQMGYSQDTISDALSVIKEKNCNKGNTTCPPAAEILETIFAMEQGATCKDKKDVTVEPEIKNEDKTDCNKTLVAVTNGMETVDLTDTQSLIEENRQLKEDRLCKICMDNDASIAFLPCGHLVCCADCAPAMRKCPVCRDYIRGTVKTWLV